MECFSWLAVPLTMFSILAGFALLVWAMSK